MPYAARFQKHRRWVLDYFSEQAMGNHRDIQRNGVAQLLLGLLETPDAFLEHIKMRVAQLVTCL